MKLDKNQQRIVAATYEVFRSSGRWPSVEVIDRFADSHWELDAFPVIQSLPSSVALIDRIHLREDQPIKLRLAAIATCGDSSADLELFVRALRWLVEHERAFWPSSLHAAEQLRVSSEQFVADMAAERLELDSIALRKVYELASIEGVTSGGSFDIEDESGRWEINLTRAIRPYRRVETLADYFAIRERLDAAADEEPASRSPCHPSPTRESRRSCPRSRQRLRRQRGPTSSSRCPSANPGRMRYTPASSKLARSCAARGLPCDGSGPMRSPGQGG